MVKSDTLSPNPALVNSQSNRYNHQPQPGYQNIIKGKTEMITLEQAARETVAAIMRAVEMGVDLPATITNAAMRLDTALNNAPTTAIESTKFGTYVIRKPNGSLATHYGGTVAEFKTRAEAESCVGLLVN
jgi:hypothetical protein